MKVAIWKEKPVLKIVTDCVNPNPVLATVTLVNTHGSIVTVRVAARLLLA